LKAKDIRYRAPHSQKVLTYRFTVYRTVRYRRRYHRTLKYTSTISSPFFRACTMLRALSSLPRQGRVVMNLAAKLSPASTRYFSDSVTYSGGQATTGQGGFYGSGGSRVATASPAHHPEAIARQTDVIKLTQIMVNSLHICICICMTSMMSLSIRLRYPLLRMKCIHWAQR
jgi:hypothetical protein